MHTVVLICRHIIAYNVNVIKKKDVINAMIKIRTHKTQNKNIPTEYYTKKIEFNLYNDIIFWDEELKEWILIKPDDIISITG